MEAVGWASMELTTLAPTVASHSRTTSAHVAMERLASSVAFEGFSKKVDIISAALHAKELSKFRKLFAIDIYAEISEPNGATLGPALLNCSREGPNMTSGTGIKALPLRCLSSG